MDAICDLAITVTVKFEANASVRKRQLHLLGRKAVETNPSPSLGGRFFNADLRTADMCLLSFFLLGASLFVLMAA